jgi:hypothetical protein
MHTNDAVDTITALVKTEANRHPELGLSFGYIGNIDRFGDDRGWRVFSNRTQDGRSFSLDLGGTANLQRALERMPVAFPRFVEAALKADRRY